MARKIVFTNSIGGVLTADSNGNPFAITKAEGLGVPGINLQTQKAPYQDGTTYIDSLLDNRMLSFELTINKPNAFADIDTARRELVSKLNPKLGPGVLVYTTEGGSSYRINATVSAVTIPDKRYQEPFLRVLVQLTANDPMWMDVADYTVSLPAKTTSAETTINGGGSTSPSVIELANGDLFVAYVRLSDSYLVSRTYTSSWSAESVINSASSSTPSIIQLANGNLFLVYKRSSDGYLVSRTYTSSWSAESVINSADSGLPSVIQLANGNLFLVYIRAPDGYLASRTYTSSWSAESVVNSASSSTPSVIQLANGNLFLAYRNSASIVSRTFTSSWSAESTVNTGGGIYISLIQLENGNILIVYKNQSTNYLVSRTYMNSWSIESVLNEAESNWPSVIQLSNGDLFFAYTKTPGNALASRLRIPTPFPITISGDVPSPIIATFPGPAFYPQIINQVTGEYIQINTELANGDSVVVNTAFGQKTVVLTKGGIVSNGNAFLDIGSTFLQLEPGANTLYFDEGNQLATATASLVYTNRYVGV